MSQRLHADPIFLTPTTPLDHIRHINALVQRAIFFLIIASLLRGQTENLVVLHSGSLSHQN